MKSSYLGVVRTLAEEELPKLLGFSTVTALFGGVWKVRLPKTPWSTQRNVSGRFVV
jgi:hypothetical protein